MSSTWGWSCCPACGAVIADIAEHVIWHELVVQEVLTDMVDEAVREALEAHEAPPPPRPAPGGGTTTTARLIPTQPVGGEQP